MIALFGYTHALITIVLYFDWIMDLFTYPKPTFLNLLETYHNNKPLLI